MILSRRSSSILLLALALAACAAPAPQAPPSEPAPAPAPLPPPPPAADWRDAPLTPGDWRYSPAGGGDSVARFGDGLFEARCMASRRVVALTRKGPLVTSATPRIAITTSTSTLTLTAAPTQAGAVAELAAANSGLDQIAFSRGRFVVAVAGLETLIIPSWPEFARVVEDCRRLVGQP